VRALDLTFRIVDCVISEIKHTFSVFRLASFAFASRSRDSSAKSAVENLYNYGNCGVNVPQVTSRLFPPENVLHETGMLTVQRMGDMDSRSRHFDEMCTQEEEAKAAGKGVHGGSAPPAEAKYTELVMAAGVDRNAPAAKKAQPKAQLLGAGVSKMAVPMGGATSQKELSIVFVLLRSV